jgi:sigma-B regulation protein RsbU (phosphoserine phosphatase)
MDRGNSSPLLSWLLLPVTAALVLSALSLPLQPYTGLVLRGEQVVAVDPGGPAERAGLAPGDHLVQQPGQPAFTRSPLAYAVPGEPMVLLRERGHRMARIRMVPMTQPDGERRMMAALLAVASGFVLIGGWVWSERRDQLTRTFFLLCLAFAWFLAPLPRWRSEASGALYDTLYTGVGLYLPALFIHFFALFPESGQPRGRLRSTTTIAYGVATGIFGASFLIMLAEPVFGAIAAAAQSLIQSMAGLWFAFGLLGALYVFAGSYRRARSADARRRLRVALVGTALGALPFATLVAVRNLSPHGPIPGERLAVILTLLVPASFAWATGVHRVFEFKVALRAAVVLVVLATLSGLVYATGEWLAAAWRQDLGSGLAGGALTFVALTAAVAGPASRWLRSLGARFIPDVATATERLDASPGARGSTPGHVVEAACQALAEAFHLDGCLALEFAQGGLRTVARAGVTVSPPSETDFTAALPEGGGVVALDDLQLRATDRRALERAGVAWLLPVGGTVRHCLMLGRRLGGSWFGIEDQRELRRFAGHLEALMENAHLREAASTHGAMGRELSKAGAIQAHLLPRRVPVFRSLDCAAAALSSELVGGDYYDFVRSPGPVVTLAVGDAAGKGIPAALMGTWAHAAFRDRARRGAAPGELLSALNHDLVALNQPQAFVALLCARVDVRAATFTFANAGLTPPLLRRRDGRFEELCQSGVLLGVAPRAQYENFGVELDAGDIIVLYSDGLTEARRGEEEFGAEGVRRVLESHARKGASEILRALLAEVQAFTDQPLDDVTVVVLKQLTRPARVRPGPCQEELKFQTQAADYTR